MEGISDTTSVGDFSLIVLNIMLWKLQSDKNVNFENKKKEMNF